MQRILVFIRSDINSEKNIELVNILIICMENRMNNFELIKLLNGKLDLKQQLIQDAGLECVDDKNISDFILTVLKYTNDALKSQNYNMAYDLVDMLHVLPDVIITGEKKQLKKYWNIYVKPFIKKWKNNEIARVCLNIH